MDSKEFLRIIWHTTYLNKVRWYKLDSTPPQQVDDLGIMSWFCAYVAGYKIQIMFCVENLSSHNGGEQVIYFVLEVETLGSRESCRMSSKPSIFPGEKEPEEGWLASTYLLARYAWMQRYDLGRFSKEYKKALLEDDFWDHLIPDGWDMSIIAPELYKENTS